MSEKKKLSRMNKHKQPTTKKKPSNKKNYKKIIFRVLIGFVVLGVIGLLSGIGLFYHYAKDSPKLDDSSLSATSSSKLYTANEEFFEDLGSERRDLITSTEIPQLLIDAIVSVEDRRFYKHHGFDPIRIIGSAFSNLTTGGRQGGSTLTQQLIKLSYFSTKESDQTIKRKAQEAWLAWKLENEKSKEEILTYYINKVYMANGLYGMETAATQYYGKSLSELDLPQTALLAGMPQAPTSYDPYTNPDLAKERRDVVLFTMKNNQKITEKEYKEAIETPIEEGLQSLQEENENKKITQSFNAEVVREIEEKTGIDPYTEGLKIYTTLDLDAQEKLYNIVNTDEYVKYPDEDMQVATSVIDVKTGQVRAQIGTRNAKNTEEYLPDNLALNVTRDVGSTMKPLIDYGPAIEYLDYSTGKIMVDGPTTYSGTDIPINNADLTYYGSITMRKAIMHSRNTTAVQTFNEVGKDNAAEFLGNVGIEFADLMESNAISSNTATIDENKYGISSLKLAAAYAAFANEGVYNKPSYVTKIIYPDGTEETFETDSQRAMKDSTAYMMTSMLKDVISGGTAFNADIPDLIQAGKTGTANYTDDELLNLAVDPSLSVAPDSTFVGYSTHYSIAVWTGYNDRNTPITSDYWGTASDIYREIMLFLSQNVSNDDWVKPDSVTQIGQELYVKDAYERYNSYYPGNTQDNTNQTPNDTTNPYQNDYQNNQYYDNNNNNSNNNSNNNNNNNNNSNNNNNNNNQNNNNQNNNNNNQYDDNNNNNNGQDNQNDQNTNGNTPQSPNYPPTGNGNGNAEDDTTTNSSNNDEQQNNH